MEIEIIKDIEFSPQNKNLKLNLFKPREATAKPMPAIVYIHGGAWLRGNREWCNPGVNMFVKNGFLAVSIDYRLSQEAVFPAQILDCKCAVRFLRSKSREFNIDSDKIGCWGDSAGGHLCALLGTSAGVAELEGEGGWKEHFSGVNAVCDWYGPVDFLKSCDYPSEITWNAADSPPSKLVGCPIQSIPDKSIAANPITYIKKQKNLPPFLIMHGEEDIQVPLNQSELLYMALKNAGADVTFEIIKGQGHGFSGKDILSAVYDFFTKKFNWA